MRSASRKAISTLMILIVATACMLSGCRAGGGEGAGRKRVVSAPRWPAGKAASGGRTLYVSPSGKNANPGTAGKPWATPGYGSKQLQPGDTLVILGGRYSLSEFWDDMITPPTGTAGGWITIKGEAENRPVLAGKGDLFSAVDISKTSYVRIENLEITSDGGAKFRGGVEAAGGPVNHAVLKDLYIHHIDEEAVNIGDVDDFQILGCRFAYCGFGCIGGPAGQHGGNRNVLVRDCYLGYSGHYYQGGPGPSPYDRPDAFGLEPSEGPIEIANTVAEHNRGDGLDSKCANTYIHDCIVANNSCDGVKLWNGVSRLENTLIYGTGDGVGGGSPWAGIVLGGSDNPNARFEVFNVTLHDNPARDAYPIYAQYDEPTPITVLMRNTTISNGSGPVYMGDSVTFLADHNNFYCPGGEIQVEANGKGYTAAQVEAGALGRANLSRDPLFVAPAWGKAGDYHLRAGSPLIDAGTSEGAPSSDLDGNPRPVGEACDTGAYEYGSGHGISKTWYMAEGCTASGFETFVLVQNPGDTDALVNLTYMTGTAEVQGPELSLKAHTRGTVNVGDTVPDTYSVSTKVSSDKPVIAERATYWQGRTGGHASIGVTG